MNKTIKNNKEIDENPINKIINDNTDQTNLQVVKNQESSKTPIIEDHGLIKRRSSSLSDFKTRHHRKVEALLDEDDKDIELQRLNEMKNKNNIINSHQDNYLKITTEIDIKSQSENEDDFFDKQLNTNSRNFSDNNSSVDRLVSSDNSDFSSDSRDQID